MDFVVTGPALLVKELTDSTAGASWTVVKNCAAFDQYPGADAFFNLAEDAIVQDYSGIKKPVFVNSVTGTLQEKDQADNVYRIIGWTGFLKRSSWEYAGKIMAEPNLLAAGLNKKLWAVKDEPGLVSARIISMIINEAYFTVGDGVSTKEETDVAMKLGTNYPFGPFEWAALIGTRQIVTLLQKLEETDKRYRPAPMLVTEVNATS